MNYEKAYWMKNAEPNEVIFFNETDKLHHIRYENFNLSTSSNKILGYVSV